MMSQTPTEHHRASDHDNDATAVRQAAMDYMQGWYEADAERMGRSLHPELAKRGLVRDPQTGEQRVRHLGKQQMVEKTQQGGGSEVPTGLRTYDPAILDISGDIACVRAESYDYVDYLQLARIDGQWLIVNVLWGWGPHGPRQ